MAAATRSRRPVPQRVYWFRRLMVLAVACALVWGIARLLDYSTGGSESEQATAVSASPEVSATKGPGKKRKDAAPAAEEEKSAEDPDEGRDRPIQPDGPCADEDVIVTPSVKYAHAGSPVKIVLEVTTVEADACTWEVNPESVFLNIGGEDGTLWSSQHCPDAMPTKSLVPRREHAAKVNVYWNGKESDEECSPWTDWVLEGSYTAVAAARGSVTPVATGFVLGGAVAPTVTQTPTPTPSPKGDKKDGDKKDQDG